MVICYETQLRPTNFAFKSATFYEDVYTCYECHLLLHTVYVFMYKRMAEFVTCDQMYFLQYWNVWGVYDVDTNTNLKVENFVDPCVYTGL